jgi:uncharacterized protein (TIGR00251 family)
MTSFKDAIKSSKQGVILCVHVVPGSSQNQFPAGYNQWRKCIEIKVRSEAKDNKANNEVIKTITEFFKVPMKDVILMSGQNSREKTIFLGKISVDMVCSQLEESFHGL